MITITLNERPLNDDIAYITDAGKVFSGQLVAIVEYFTFANEWNDHKHRKGFKTIEALQKFVAKRYPDFDGELYQECNG
jgi:hypothetical protein